MTQSPKGFSKAGSAKKPPSASATKRKAASRQYDDLKKKGLPEFNIYIRLPEKPDNWLPIGSLAVSRSSAISQAIFQNEAELVKGALRLFPRLARHKDRLEYGYRLKDKLYQSDPIQAAIRPKPSFVQQLIGRWQSWIRQLSGKAQPTLPKV